MSMFPKLEIPDTLAAGPGPGNTDPRVLEAFASAGVAVDIFFVACGSLGFSFHGYHE